MASGLMRHLQTAGFVCWRFWARLAAHASDQCEYVVCGDVGGLWAVYGPDLDHELRQAGGGQKCASQTGRTLPSRRDEEIFLQLSTWWR